MVKVHAWSGYRPVAESNCATVRWGEEQLEAKHQSVGTRTRFGIEKVASQRRYGEAWKSVSPNVTEKSRDALLGVVGDGMM